MPGIKPQGKTKIKWSPEFAYAIGLITTDGSLSKNGRHINFTTKDLEQAKNFKKCLGITAKLGKKRSGYTGLKIYHNIQFSDVLFYRFLEGIGLTPAKSKTLGILTIPNKYLYDFLRGHLDGDGSFYSYYDKRWKSSFMFYTVFISSSKKHIVWIRDTLRARLNINGHISKSVNSVIYQLKYAKNESMRLLKKIYYDKNVICLTRKRLKIEKALSTVNLSL
ncbi:MAG: LAGLIDADG family homing endonuclease [Parcubacteria group bacterium]